MKIGQITDIHLFPEGTTLPSYKKNMKRISGYMNIKFGRGTGSNDTFEQVMNEIVNTDQVNHLFLTGDITNISLEQEFENARRIIDKLYIKPMESKKNRWMEQQRVTKDQQLSPQQMSPIKGKKNQNDQHDDDLEDINENEVEQETTGGETSLIENLDKDNEKEKEELHGKEREELEEGSQKDNESSLSTTTPSNQQDEEKPMKKKKVETPLKVDTESASTTTTPEHPRDTPQTPSQAYSSTIPKSNRKVRKVLKRGMNHLKVDINAYKHVQSKILANAEKLEPEHNPPESFVYNILTAIPGNHDAYVKESVDNDYFGKFFGDTLSRFASPPPPSPSEDSIFPPQSKDELKVHEDEVLKKKNVEVKKSKEAINEEETITKVPTPQEEDESISKKEILNEPTDELNEESNASTELPVNFEENASSEDTESKEDKEINTPMIEQKEDACDNINSDEEHVNNSNKEEKKAVASSEDDKANDYEPLIEEIQPNVEKNEPIEKEKLIDNLDHVDQETNSMDTFMQDKEHDIAQEQRVSDKLTEQLIGKDPSVETEDQSQIESSLLKKQNVQEQHQKEKTSEESDKMIEEQSMSDHGKEDAKVERVQTTLKQKYFPTFDSRFPAIKILTDSSNTLIVLSLNTGVPTRPFMANGDLGPTQLLRAGKMLDQVLDGVNSRSDYAIIILMHHPPTTRFNRIVEYMGMLNASCKTKLATFCKDYDVDLILNGHTHTSYIGTLGNTIIYDPGTTTLTSPSYNLYDFQDNRLVSVYQKEYVPATVDFTERELERPNVKRRASPRPGTFAQGGVYPDFSKKPRDVSPTGSDNHFYHPSSSSDDDDDYELISPIDTPPRSGNAFMSSSASKPRDGSRHQPHILSSSDDEEGKHTPTLLDQPSAPLLNENEYETIIKQLNDSDDEDDEDDDDDEFLPSTPPSTNSPPSTYRVLQESRLSFS